MRDTPEMVQRVADALRAACLEEFGRTWSYGSAWKFARAAIEAMRKPTTAMLMAAQHIHLDGKFSGGKSSYERVIDAALATPPEPQHEETT